MKKICLLIFFLIIHSVCFATRPFASKVFTTSNYKKNVTLAINRQKPNVLITIQNDTGKILKEINENEILLSQDDFNQYNYTTAGNNWYQNSISFITQNDNFFIIRTRWGKLIIIDLNSYKINPEISKELNNEIEDIIKIKALNLVKVKEPQEQLTGVIACGQLNVAESIPHLKKLLSDENFYMHGSSEKMEKFYYLRIAAQDALEKMCVTINNKVTKNKDI